MGRRRGARGARAAILAAATVAACAWAAACTETTNVATCPFVSDGSVDPCSAGDAAFEVGVQGDALGPGDGGAGSSSGSSSSGGSSSGASSSGASSSSGSSSGAKHEGGASSSSGGGSGSGSGSGSSGGACPPTLPEGGSFRNPSYTPATASKGKCSASDTQAFISACGPGGTAAACNTWQDQNVLDGGTACGDCIFAENDNGATYVTSDGNGSYFFFPGYAACAQLMGGSEACSSDVDDYTACREWYCGYCEESGGSGTDIDACDTGAAAGPCAQQYGAFMTDCTSETDPGQPLDACGWTADNVTNAIWTTIVDEVCGKPGDGG